jgi:predicted transcriptional regulator
MIDLGEISKNSNIPDKVTLMRKYNVGFKTLKDIGQHIQIPETLFNHLSKLSTKLIYGYLRSYLNGKNGKASVSIKKIAERSGYGDNKVSDAIATLSGDGLINIIEIPRRNGFPFYEYTFAPHTKFERITNYFLDHPLLTLKEKEFIFSLSLKILPNDCIGSLENPVNAEKITEWINYDLDSEISLSTVKRRLSSLTRKGFVKKKDSRISGGYDPEWTGYEFDMFAIMFPSEEIGKIKEKIEKDKFKGE